MESSNGTKEADQFRAKDFYLSMSSKPKTTSRVLSLSIFDSLTKKQYQIDISLNHVDCISKPRDEIEGIIRQKFDDLLKAVNI